MPLHHTGAFSFEFLYGLVTLQKPGRAYIGSTGPSLTLRKDLQVTQIWQLPQHCPKARSSMKN